MYPHTLVTMFHVQMMDVFKEVVSYTPSLPRHFYDAGTTTQWRQDFLEGSEINTALERAKKANIIITGIGVLEDRSFQAIAADLGRTFRIPSTLDVGTPEICYAPILPDGSVLRPFDEAVIGLKPEDLHQAATRGQAVYAIAGGRAKAVAMGNVLNMGNIPFNTLITDQAVCDVFLRT